MALQNQALDLSLYGRVVGYPHSNLKQTGLLYLPINTIETKWPSSSVHTIYITLFLSFFFLEPFYPFFSEVITYK